MEEGEKNATKEWFTDYKKGHKKESKKWKEWIKKAVQSYFDPLYHMILLNMLDFIFK